LVGPGREESDRQSGEEMRCATSGGGGEEESGMLLRDVGEDIGRGERGEN